MSRNPAGKATAPLAGRGSARQGRHHHNAAQPNQADTVDWWMSTYGHNAAGGFEWVGRGYIDADAEKVAAVLLTVRPGPVGADNAAMLDTAFWSRLRLTGGPRRYVGRLGEATVLIDTDPGERTFALQGRFGWRIVTQLEPHASGTTVIRRIQHLSRAKRMLVPLLQKTPFGLRGDLRRLTRAVRRHA
jgi:hypothetical protein